MYALKQPRIVPVRDSIASADTLVDALEERLIMLHRGRAAHDQLDAGMSLVLRELRRARAKFTTRCASTFDAEGFEAFLPVVDGLERAWHASFDFAPHETARLAGVLVWLLRALERQSVVPDSPLGATFDPYLHEAVATSSSADANKGEIVEVIERGWRVSGDWVRRSRVVVAS